MNISVFSNIYHLWWKPSKSFPLDFWNIQHITVICCYPTMQRRTSYSSLTVTWSVLINFSRPPVPRCPQPLGTILLSTSMGLMTGLWSIYNWMLFHCAFVVHFLHPFICRQLSHGCGFHVLANELGHGSSGKEFAGVTRVTWSKCHCLTGVLVSFTQQCDCCTRWKFCFKCFQEPPFRFSDLFFKD